MDLIAILIQDVRLPIKDKIGVEVHIDIGRNKIMDQLVNPVNLN